MPGVYSHMQLHPVSGRLRLSHHEASSDQGCFPDGCMYGLEIRITCSSIDNRMELCLKRNRVAAPCYLEIRCIRAAVDQDVVQRAGVTPNRREHSANSFNRAQVSIA